MDEIEILYEDNHLIAINKHSSDLAQGDNTGDSPLANKVADYLKVKYGDYMTLPPENKRKVHPISKLQFPTDGE